jgi:hypothetical protein
MVQGFDLLCAHSTDVVVLEPVAMAALRGPASVKQCESHEEAEAVRCADLPELPDTFDFGLAKLQSRICRRR